MEKQTRELILARIKTNTETINLNAKLDDKHEQWKEFHLAENALLKANNALLEKALVEDNLTVIFEFTDQL